MEGFEELRELGRGAFGDVVLARRVADGRLCAVKSVRIATISKGELKESQMEVRALQALNHPCILHYFESHEDKHTLRIVTEYADCGDLQQHLQCRVDSGLRFEAVVLFALMAQLSIAIAYAHGRKVMHRDLKPANVFLTKRGLIKLGDFGVAKVMAGTYCMEQATCVGSPTYMAPEIVSGEPYGPACDVWSLGVMLYELCTLRKPFEGHSLAEVVMRISSGAYQNVREHLVGHESGFLVGAVTPLLEVMIVVDVKARGSISEVICSPVLGMFIASMGSGKACLQAAFRSLGAGSETLHTDELADADCAATIATEDAELQTAGVAALEDAGNRIRGAPRSGERQLGPPPKAEGTADLPSRRPPSLVNPLGGLRSVDEGASYGGADSLALSSTSLFGGLMDSTSDDLSFSLTQPSGTTSTTSQLAQAPIASTIGPSVTQDQTQACCTTLGKQDSWSNSIGPATMREVDDLIAAHLSTLGPSHSPVPSDYLQRTLDEKRLLAAQLASALDDGDGTRRLPAELARHENRCRSDSRGFPSTERLGRSDVSREGADVGPSGFALDHDAILPEFGTIGPQSASTLASAHLKRVAEEVSGEGRLQRIPLPSPGLVECEVRISGSPNSSAASGLSGGGLSSPWPRQHASGCGSAGAGAACGPSGSSGKHGLQGRVVAPLVGAGHSMFGLVGGASGSSRPGSGPDLDDVGSGSYMEAAELEEKSATWPLESTNLSTFSDGLEEDIMRFKQLTALKAQLNSETLPAGRPTTPQALRRTRRGQEAEREKLPQSVCLTIPFFDRAPGHAAPAPPKRFSEAMEADELRRNWRSIQKEEPPEPSQTLTGKGSAGNSGTRRVVQVSPGSAPVVRAPGAFGAAAVRTLESGTRIRRPGR